MATEWQYAKDHSLEGEEFEYLPVDKEDVMHGRCKCDRCGKFSNVFFYKFFALNMRRYAVCAECVLEFDPPKLELMLATTSPIENGIIPAGLYNIWDNTNSKQEFAMSIKDFVKCGWFIRNLEEEHQNISKKTIIKVNLEYHGGLLCSRAMDHYKRLGLEDLDYCKSVFCNPMRA